jgi:ribosomal protein S18 acetylase RimI-like enzyme
MNKVNKEILKNLYEFWTYIGKKTNRLVENDHYKSVSVVDSDWPNRVFSISAGEDILPDIIDLIQEKLLPNIIAMPKPNSLENHPHAKLFLRQRNMALNLKTVEINSKNDENIKQVRTKEDALKFANIASDAFGYKVDGNIIYLVSEDSSKVRIFTYLQNNEYLGCGIVFFDANNNAGLHMIGTTPNGRGKGIGTKMTEKLLWEAKANKSENCVLHASMMGENIYKKLGFISFGELETYRILEK